MSYFPYDGHNGTHSCKSNGRDLEFRVTFSQFVLEKSEGNFIFTRKFKRCYNINFFYRLWEKYVLFSLNVACNGNFCPP